MDRLLDPIEAAGVFQSRMIGQLRLYSLPAEPWAEATAKLAKAVLLTGGYSNRVHLRRELGFE
jgi:hypothetical protein